MEHRDLNPAKVKRYIAENTSLFPAGTELAVSEIGRNEVDGDGYVNYIYRVCSANGNSVILKQAKPYFKYFGKDEYPLTRSRNISEVEIGRIRASIVPQYIPKILHADNDNFLYVVEDCGHLGIMRFGLSRGKRYPNFPGMMGECIAKCNFYTSELYLEQGLHKELGRHFTNPEMSRIMEIILFLREPLLEGADSEIPDPAHMRISDSFWDNKNARIELFKLRDIYMKKQECIVHGDLHTSNIMASGGEIKLIDMEYPHMGPFSSDSGYLLGNLVYTYATWFYHEEWTEDERARYRDEILGYIEGTLAEYMRVFRECWSRDAKAMFRPYPEYLESLFLPYLQETAGFMGSQICSRVGGGAETFDFDVLPNPAKRNEARALAMAMGYALLMRRGDVQTPGDITRMIKDCAAEFRNVKCRMG